LELATTLQALGGLGIFLLGMVIMTDSLKKLAGDRLRLTLFELTKTPVSGAATGALTTAIVQSSSATTVAAVGFVGAGLMTFSNALGIIFGANIGTTITGWMVALFGFKLSIDSFALPLIFIGVLLRLLSSTKLATLGLVIAGFGLLFVGIELLQTGMADMINLFNFAQLSTDSIFGLLKLVLIGLAFTLVTQSSSAGVAVTLTALFSGMIEFEQAAALIIGMDVGTTVKSWIASLGGTIGAKRTGLSHVVYNLMTAVMALLLITPYIAIINWIFPGATTDNAELALVGFHSFFNLIGVLAILPFTRQFASLIETIIPDNRTNLTNKLEPKLLEVPELALNAVQQTLLILHKALLTLLHKRLVNENVSEHHITQLQLELDETQVYLDRIHLQPDQHALWKRLVSMIHSLDHLQRLHERCEEEADRAIASKSFPTLAKANQRLTETLPIILSEVKHNKFSKAVSITRELNDSISHETENYRNIMVEKMGRGEIEADQCWDSLEAVRWMNRVSHHLYRISYHLQKSL